MNFSTDLAQFITAGFPNRSETDPNKKTPAWIKQMAAGGLTELYRSRAQWKLWCFDDDIAENSQYAAGEQDTKKYIRTKSGNDTLDGRSIEVTNRDGYFEGETYVPRSGGGRSVDPTGLDSIINAQPLPVLPVKLQALKALIKQKYEISITALGQKAKKERAEHEAEVRLWMDFGTDYQQQGMTPPPGLPSPIPQTEPELQTYLSTWQVAAAADLELKIQIADVESDTEQQMDEVADDILTHGYGGLFAHYRPGKRTIGKRILPHRGLFLPSAFPDYRDATMGGILETISYEALRSEVEGQEKYTCATDGKQWKKEDWGNLENLAAQSIGNDLTELDPEIGIRTNSGAFTVVRWFFLTDDRRTWKTYEDNAGNTRTRPQGAAYELAKEDKGKLTETLVNSLYEATLICGTNLAYGCRKVLDQGRDLHDPLKARLPFALYSAGVTRGRPVSIVRRVKGIVDEMERSWRGYMADMRTYTPEGYNMQLKALETMVEGMKLKGEDAIMDAYRHFKQTGDTFADLINQENQQIGLAVTKNPTGIPASAALHFNSLLQQLQLLEALTGANAVVSAATPGSEAGKGVSQIALQGAANVMSFARDGLRKVYERWAKNLAGRIRITDAEIPTTGTVPGPDGDPREVGPRKDFHEYGFHMRVDLGPSDEEWAELYAKANEASTNGQITVADEMMLKWLRNLKTAQRYLAVAVMRKGREDQKNELAKMQANADSQTQTGKAVAEAQTASNTQNNKEKMELAVFQRETTWGAIQRQVDAQERVAQTNVSGKIAVAHISEQGAAEREAMSDDRAHEHDHVAAIRDAMLTPPTPAAA